MKGSLFVIHEHIYLNSTDLAKNSTDLAKLQDYNPDSQDYNPDLRIIILISILLYYNK